MSQMGSYTAQRGNHGSIDPSAGNPHSIGTKGGADASPSAFGTALEALSSLFESSPKPEPSPKEMLADAMKRTGAVVHSGPSPFRGHG